MQASFTHLSEFEQRISRQRQVLLAHPIYRDLKDLESVQRFMRFHVFAVWDFMSLLKSLQARLTCVTLPWLPASDPQLSRFINDIVLAEESDEIHPGHFLSHFELYMRAMGEVGADTAPIEHFLSRVRESADFDELLEQLSPEGGVFEFMASTFRSIRGETHEVAAAFLFGREDIIPEMFAQILKRVDLLHSEKHASFRRYLERHIEVDGDHHGPLARKMLISLCGDSAEKWKQAESAAVTAIKSRVRLWDSIRLPAVLNQEVGEVSHAIR